MKLKKIYFIIIICFLITSCDIKNSFKIDYNNSVNYDNYDNSNNKISINKFFSNETTTYLEKNLKMESQCIIGNCETEKFENKTYKRDCYFCNMNILDLGNNRLELTSTRYSSGNADFTAGCQRKYSGKEMNGFDIIKINSNIIIAKGEIITYYSQKSTPCDKSKDPECDDQTYGYCDGNDYEIKYIRTVELIFNK